MSDEEKYFKETMSSMAQDILLGQYPGVHQLWSAVVLHPDFVAGTVFTKQDLADYYYQPKESEELGAWYDDEATPEQVAALPDHIFDEGRMAIESYLENRGYGWREALQDCGVPRKYEEEEEDDDA